MRLRRLAIKTLPGIEPGFTFEPPDTGITIVTGPNAIGKSSLARALKHLLGGVDRRNDPPALSLEAEFGSGDTRWQVRRNGGQIRWMRDGEVATAPSLPSGDQINLYRLSMESLLVDDQNDKALAERLWRDLRGGFDLDEPRIALGSRWGRKEGRALATAHHQLGEVERRYAALQADEAKLPDLDRRIETAVQAHERLDHLQQAMELGEALDRRQNRQQALDRFPADMAKLKGDELDRLDNWGSKADKLRQDLEEERRKLEAAQEEREASGLAAAAPQAEEVNRIEESLNALDRQASDRGYAQKDANAAEAGLRDAQAQFEGGGEAPNLSADSLERARGIVEPLIDDRARLSELKQQLKLADEPPDDWEIDQLRAGVQALRAWLAASGQPDQTPRRQTRPISFAALALAAIAAVTALFEQAWWTLTGILATGAAVFWTLMAEGRRRAQPPSPSEKARREFRETGLEPPEDWSAAAVGEHLRRTVEQRLNDLILQRARASGAAKLGLQVEETGSEIKRLEAQKTELARAIGINPVLAGAPFYRFIDVTGTWDQARRRREEKKAALDRLDGEIATQATEVRDFLGQWRSADAPAFDASGSDSAIEQLRIASRELNERLQTANDAQHEMESCRKEIRSLESQIAEIDKDTQNLFADVALEPQQGGELADRIDRLPDWKAAREALSNAIHDADNRRASLAEHSELIAAIEGGAIERLKGDLEDARRKADTHTQHIEERQRIITQLDAAGRGHDLERAASELDGAVAALEDKRDEALRHQATEVLLDEVEGQFKSEHEPDLLRRAKERFQLVTAHAFTLELAEGNRFAARDLAQGKLRKLEELSSGTRMQLLLALRLAWTEAQEQGGESLPLFLDEALTTSDEDRFAVMAKTLTRLAEAGDRQIFYLSARRHESALWRQATGAEPAVIDLAEIRYGATRLEAEAFQVETPPSLPPPAGHDAASYAASIGVPPFDPHLEPGGAHLFHLLRDDLELLHRLMDTWRISSLGQLEALLGGNAATGAIPEDRVQNRLERRCQAARAWVELWRQGRGRPVSRAVLEQCGAVSATFIDRTAELADELQGDGSALIDGLRHHRLPHFYASKTDELEQWLADEGYTDDQDRLPPDERRRLTLAAVAPPSPQDAADLNQLVNWLEGSGERE